MYIKIISIQFSVDNTDADPRVNYYGEYPNSNMKRHAFRTRFLIASNEARGPLAVNSQLYYEYSLRLEPLA